MRIAVVGSSGAGKTTLAMILARRYGLPFIEVDGMYHGPDWIPNEEFGSEFYQLLTSDLWVIDSIGYGPMRDLTFRSATHLVWLDLPRMTCTIRVLRRSLARAVTGIELWNGNRETIRNLFHPDGPVCWAWRHHRTRREWIEKELQHPETAHLKVTRLTSQRDVARWVGGHTI